MVPNIHLLGIQGSGKGTQSARLVKKYGFSYIASGDLFRARAQQADQFGQELAQQLTTGHLLEDKFLFQTVEDYLNSTPVQQGVLGDGVIRTVAQYQGLEDVWSHHQIDEPLLIHLVLTEEKALERIAHRKAELEDPAQQAYHLAYSGKLLKRTDDNPLAIQERFKLFHSMTEPVIEIFENSGRCIHISADRPIEEINQDISQAIEYYYPTLSHVSHQE